MAKTYQDMKEILKGQHESTKYFNKKVYETWLKDYASACKALETGENPQACYDETHKTDFYIKNGGAYCVMLQYAH